MEAVLARFNRKLVFEDRKVILFLNDATCHPESMIGQFSQIKIIVLPNNETSRLRPLDAGLIQNFKVKYGKRLVKHVLGRIQEDASATQIVIGVDVLVAIWWLQEAWKKATNLIIKNCFQKCSNKGDNELMEVEKNWFGIWNSCKGTYYGYIYWRIREFRWKCSSVWAND